MYKITEMCAQPDYLMPVWRHQHTNMRPATASPAALLPTAFVSVRLHIAVALALDIGPCTGHAGGSKLSLAPRGDILQPRLDLVEVIAGLLWSRHVFENTVVDEIKSN